MGGLTSFEVIARDQMGNPATYPPLSSSGYSFDVSTDGPAPASISVGELTNGRQKVSLRFVTVGRYTISVSPQGGGPLVGGATHQLDVLPAQLDARYCRLTGDGLRVARAGDEGCFMVHARDKHGNPMAGGEVDDDGSAFEVKLKYLSSVGGGADDDAAAAKQQRRVTALLTAIQGSVSRSAPGEYRARFTATRAGVYELRVFCRGTLLYGCPFEVVVHAGPTHPGSCMRLYVVDPVATISAIAGTASSFTLAARDFYGNARREGGDALVAGLSGPSKQRCEVCDNDDGSYTVSYRQEVAGDYALSVMLRNEHVLGSPFLLRIQPNLTHGPSCQASGTGLTLGAVGEPSSFMIEARDALGNSRGMGGDATEVQIVPLGSDGADPSVAIRPHVRDCEDGWYEVSYTVDTIGRYLLHMSVSGEPLASSPSHLVISGGRTYGPACIRKGSRPTDRELPPALAGLPYSFLIEARDDFDVPRGKGGDPFQICLSGPEQRAGELDDLGDGTYEVKFTPGLAGSYLVGVTLNGLHIAGSRFALLVQPSSAHAPSCVGSGTGLRLARAGEPARFAVQTWDAYGNICSPPLSSFSVKLSCESSPIAISPKGVEVGNGRFTFSYATNVAGTYKAHIAVATRTQSSEPGFQIGAGALSKVEMLPIAGSPFTIDVRPGPTHPSACGVRWLTPRSLKAGDSAKLVLQSRDRYFNPRDEGGDRFTISLRATVHESGGSEGSAVPSANGGAHNGEVDGHGQAWPHGSAPARVVVVRGQVEDRGDGSYAATVRATEAAEYRLDVTLQPATAEAGAAAAEEGADDEPTAEDLEAVAADHEYAVHAEAASAPYRGRHRMQAGPQLSIGTTATIIGRTHNLKSRAARAVAEAKKRGRRIYSAEVTVRPEATHPPSCLVSGEGIWGGRVFARGTWLMQPRDVFHNVTVEHHRAFDVSMTLLARHESEAGDADDAAEGGSLRDASVTVSEGPGGAALASYICNVPGTYRVDVRLRGAPVASSPFECVVSPAEEPLKTLGERQAAVRRFRAGALHWTEETVSYWEEKRPAADEYVRRQLSMPGVPIALGSETARTWALSKVDPASYLASQLDECEGGVAGVRGRYDARKRAAMLHYRLSAMSSILATGGISAPDPKSSGNVAQRARSLDATPRSASPPLDPPQHAHTARAGGASARTDASATLPRRTRSPPPRPSVRNAPDAVELGLVPAGAGISEAATVKAHLTMLRRRERAALKAAAEPSPPPAEAPPAPAPLKKGPTWSRLRQAKRAARPKRQEAEPASWRVLPPPPRPPSASIPGALTPRAKSLAMTLEGLMALGG